MSTSCSKLPPLAALLLSLSALSSPAAPLTWYLNGNQAAGTSWNTSGVWKSNPDGTGTTGTVNFSDYYYVNGYSVRTTDTTGTSTFGGNTLVMNSGTGGATSSLLLKAATTNITNLIAGSASMSNSLGTDVGTVATLNITTLTVTGSFTVGTSASRTTNLRITTLTGAGDFTFNIGSSSVVTFRATTVSAYSGDIFLRNTTGTNTGTLDFNSSFTSTGALVVETGTSFLLDQTLSFYSLTIGSTSLAAGTYTSDYLKANYSEFASSTSGSITVVPEPRTCALLFASVGLLLTLRRHRRLTF